MKTLSLAAVLGLCACGRSDLLHPDPSSGSGDGGGAAGGVAGGAGGGAVESCGDASGGGGSSTCAPSSLCAATAPLSTGFVAPISPVWASGGGTVAIAFDALDRPVIASVLTAKNLRTHLEVRRFEAGRWVQLGCDLTEDLPDRIIHMRMALGPDGKIAIVWKGQTPGGAREIGVTVWDGAAWHRLPRPHRMGSADGSLAIAMVGGQPIVAWGLLTPANTVRSFVARWDGTCWAPLGDALTGPLAQSTEVSSIAIDRDGQPMILLLVGIAQSAGTVIELRKWNGAAWVKQTALPQPHALIQSVIGFQLDRQGRPVVAWNDFDLTTARPPPLFAEVARLEDGAWRLLGAGGSIVDALALGPDDEPWRSLLELSAGDTLPSLSIEQWNGTAWDPILSKVFRNQVGSDVELAVSSRGQPASIWVTASPGTMDPLLVRVWQPVSAACP